MTARELTVSALLVVSMVLAGVAFQGTATAGGVIQFERSDPASAQHPSGRADEGTATGGTDRGPSPSVDIFDPLKQTVSLEPGPDEAAVVSGGTYTFYVTTGVEKDGLLKEDVVSEPYLDVSVDADAEGPTPVITGVASRSGDYDAVNRDLSREELFLSTDEFGAGSLQRALVRVRVPEGTDSFTLRVEVGRSNDPDDTVEREYSVASSAANWETLATRAKQRKQTAARLATAYDRIVDRRDTGKIIERGVGRTFYTVEKFTALLFASHVVPYLGDAYTGYEIGEYIESLSTDEKFDGPWVGPAARAQMRMVENGFTSVELDRVDVAGNSSYILNRIRDLAEEEARAWRNHDRKRALEKLRRQREYLTPTDSYDGIDDLRTPDTLAENVDSDGVTMGDLEAGMGGVFNLYSAATKQKIDAGNGPRTSWGSEKAFENAELYFAGVRKFSTRTGESIEQTIEVVRRPEPGVTLENEAAVERQLATDGPVRARFSVSNSGGPTSIYGSLSLTYSDGTLEIEEIRQIDEESDGEVRRDTVYRTKNRGDYVNDTLTSTLRAGGERVLTRDGDRAFIDHTLTDIHERFGPGETNVYWVNFSRTGPVTEPATLTYRVAFQPLVSESGQSSFVRAPTAGTTGAETGQQGWAVYSVENASESKPSPEFAVDIVETTSPVERGDTLEVTARLENTGGQAGTETVSLDVPGVGTTTTSVQLAAGDSTTEPFSLSTAGASLGGTTATVRTGSDAASRPVEVTARDPASFDVEFVETTSPVRAGGTLTVTADVSNTGGKSATRTVSLDVPGLGSDSTQVTLDGGQSTTVRLSVATASGDAGTYSAAVSSADDTATRAVEVTGDAATGSLVVTVRSQYGSAMGDARVELSERGGESAGERFTTAGGTAEWRDLESGTYTLDVFWNGEWWGQTSVSVRGDTSITFDRESPWESRSTGVTGTGERFQAGASVAVRTGKLWFNQTVENDDDVARTVRVTKKLDVGDDGTADETVVRGPLTIEADSERRLETAFSVAIGETHSYGLQVETRRDGEWVTTDAFDWVLAFETTKASDPAGPVAAFTRSPRRVRPGEEVTLDGSLSSGAIDRYKWDFDDDSRIDVSSDLPEARHTYDDGGTYTVTLTIVDERGRTDNVTRTVTVEPDSGSSALSFERGSGGDADPPDPWYVLGSPGTTAVSSDRASDGAMSMRVASYRSDLDQTRVGINVTLDAVDTVVVDAYVESSNLYYGYLTVHLDEENKLIRLDNRNAGRWYRDLRGDVSDVTGEHTLVLRAVGDGNDAYFDNVRFLADGERVDPATVVTGDWSPSSSRPGETLYATGFEQSAPGETPVGWVANGNSAASTTESTATNGTRSLRATGTSGGCRETAAFGDIGADSIPDTSTDVPGRVVNISFDVRPGARAEAGCHGTRNTEIKLNTDDEPVYGGSSRDLLRFDAGGTVTATAGEDVDLGTYDPGAWTDVTVTYRRVGPEVVLTYYVDGVRRAGVTRPAVDFAADLSEFQVLTGEYTTYLDDLRIATANATESPTNQPLNATFGVDTPTPTAGTPTAFDARGSTDPDGSIKGYEWDFDGDGRTDATGQEVTHAFGSAGEYDVTLTVTGGSGDTATTTRTISVSGGDDASTLAEFSETTSLTGSQTTPTNLAGKIRVESPTAVDTSVELLRSSSTNYSLAITAPEDATNVTFYLQRRAVSASQSVDGLTMYLDGQRHNYTVDGDAGPGNSPWIAFQVPHFSTRTVSFTTTSSPGAAFDYAPEQPLENEPVTFDASASTGGVVSYEWDFDGDGLTDTHTSSPTTTHAFEQPGNYTVELTVVDDGGATAARTTTVSVTPVDRDVPINPTRSVPSSVSPGGEATVTVRANASGSSVTVEETFDPAVSDVTIDRVSVDGSPVSTVSRTTEDDGLVVAVTGREPGDELTVEYTLSITDDASGGAVYSIDGTVSSNGTAATGTDRVAVSAGPFEGVVTQYNADSDGEISIGELGDAAADYAVGDLTVTELGDVAAAYARS